MMDSLNPMRPLKPLSGMSARRWWPNEMGEAASSGSSGGLRYAYFAQACRLLIEQQDQLTLYDMGEHHFRGVLQTHGADGALSFMSARGRIALGSLKIVSL
jgi:hypothetical protein